MPPELNVNMSWIWTTTYDASEFCLEFESAIPSESGSPQSRFCNCVIQQTRRTCVARLMNWIEFIPCVVECVSLRGTWPQSEELSVLPVSAAGPQCLAVSTAHRPFHRSLSILVDDLYSARLHIPGFLWDLCWGRKVMFLFQSIRQLTMTLCQNYLWGRKGRQAGKRCLQIAEWFHRGKAPAQMAYSHPPSGREGGTEKDSSFPSHVKSQCGYCFRMLFYSNEWRQMSSSPCSGRVKVRSG